MCAFAQVGEEACKPLLEGLRVTFGTDRLKTIEYGFGEELCDFMGKVSAWAISMEYMQQLQALADECGDLRFKDQVGFIHGLHLMLKALAPCATWWYRAEALGTDDARVDAQAVSEDNAQLLKDVRMQYRHFKAHCSSPDLDSLFDSHEGALSMVLGGRLAPRRIAVATLAQVDSLMVAVSQAWSSQAAKLVEQVHSWCPSGFAAQGTRKRILKDQALVDAMMGNPFYQHLPPACNLLGTMYARLKGFRSDGTQLDPPVASEILDRITPAQTLGIECVTWAFGLFLVQKQLPSVVNDTARAKLVEYFFKQCSAKGCKLGESDLQAKLDHFKKPGVVTSSVGQGVAQS